MRTTHIIKKWKDWFQLAIILAILVVFANHETYRKQQYQQMVRQDVLVFLPPSSDLHGWMQTKSYYDPLSGIVSNFAFPPFRLTETGLQPYLADQWQSPPASRFSIRTDNRTLPIFP